MHNPLLTKYYIFKWKQDHYYWFFLLFLAHFHYGYFCPCLYLEFPLFPGKMRGRKKKYTKTVWTKSSCIPVLVFSKLFHLQIPSFLWKIKTCLTKYLRVQELEAFPPTESCSTPFSSVNPTSKPNVQPKAQSWPGSPRKRVHPAGSSQTWQEVAITEWAGLLQTPSGAGLNKPGLITRRCMAVNLVINRIAGFKGKGRKPGQLCGAQHFP